jgi:hypothetical protein
MTKEEFEKLVAAFEFLQRESRAREDEYLATLQMPLLREDARRQRRWLVGTSLLLIAFWMFDLRPEKISALDLDLTGARSSVIGAGLGFAALYFWIEFAVFAARDYRGWHERAFIASRRLQVALAVEDAQREETFGSVQNLWREKLSVDNQERMHLYGKERFPQTLAWQNFLIGHGSAGVVEFGLPQAIALAGIATWVTKCFV